MPDSLFAAFSEFDNYVEKQSKKYAGLLGLPVASKTVEVPNRNGYVYVRLRDNTSEVIQAFNEKVSPVYNLPVLVTRQGNRWIVTGRDVDRYENWGSYSAFLPAHAAQHEFNRDNPGGDVAFIYADQFMPLNVSPSGTPGSPNVFISGYNFKKSDGNWTYVGNTGTQSLLLYKPTDNQARMVLVYLDRDTGSPGLLINSGTSFAASITGTADILQYLPTNSSDQEPLKAVRLVSGTTYVGWDNLYDIRQFYGGGATGTSGGGDATLTANRVVVTNDSGSQTTSPVFHFDYDNGTLVLGQDSTTPFPAAPATLFIVGSGSSAGHFLLSYGTDVASYYTFARARGDWTTPTAIQHGDVIGRAARFRAHDGAGWSVTQGEIRGQARGAWDTNSHGTEIMMGITASGTTSMQDMLTVNQAGADLLYGNYLISGSPHVHNYLVPFGVFSSINPMSVASTPYAATIDRNMTFVKFSVTSSVAGTNNVSNYWTITLVKTITGATIKRFNTSGSSYADGYDLHTTTEFDIDSVGATDKGMYITCAKVGSPGNLYLFGPLLEAS